MSKSETYVLGIDPGRSKTGLALVDSQGVIVWRGIEPTPSLHTVLQALLQEWSVSRVALGHSTGSKEALEVVEAILKEQGSATVVEIVNEKDSTLQARELYYEAFPPKGLWRLVPQSLQSPPVPIDDFAAAILARRSQEAG